MLCGAATITARRLLFGQNAQSEPNFSTDVNVVNVFATVRDKQGQIVRNLTKDDFQLEEDTRPQVIRYFSQQSDLPLTLGLLVDTSGSERRMLGTEKEASYTFLKQVLRPDKDKAFLIHFDREVELLQDLTSSRERLEKALDVLDKPEWANGSQSGGTPGGGGWGRQGGQGRHRGMWGGTAFFDAVYLGSHDLLASQIGRKALIMLTDGDDNASKVSMDEAIDSAQRADTLAYSIRIADEQPQFTRGFGGPGMGRHGGWGAGGGPYGRRAATNHVDGKKAMQQISKQTGGGYFEVSKKRPVDEIYAEIEEELRNQYSIGYTPDRPASEGGFRKIQLTVKRKGLLVQAREGYYPAKGKLAS